MMIDEGGNINDDQPLSMWLNALPPVGSDDSSEQLYFSSFHSVISAVKVPLLLLLLY